MPVSACYLGSECGRTRTRLPVRMKRREAAAAAAAESFKLFFFRWMNFAPAWLRGWMAGLRWVGGWHAKAAASLARSLAAIGSWPFTCLRHADHRTAR